MPPLPFKAVKSVNLKELKSRLLSTSCRPIILHRRNPQFNIGKEIIVTQGN